jgi:hypothetical protein
MYQHPLIGDNGQSWYAETVSYDYHMGNDRKHFRKNGKGIPLLEGKSVEQYEVVPLEKIPIRVETRRQTEPGRQYRIACADVAGTLDPRRMLCTVLPHDYATGDKLNCFLVTGDDVHRLFLVGVLNSFVIEWRVRQLARSNNIKKFMLVQIPVPRAPRSDLERVASLVAALITADKRFTDLKPWLKGANIAHDLNEREQIKCRIDAEVADLFKLTAGELERVLIAFDRVSESTKALVKKYFGELQTQAQT